MKPQLVMDRETGQLCIQVSIGAHTATLPLPDDHKTWTPTETQLYMEKVVPGMIDGLRAEIVKDRRTITRRAKREINS